MFLMRTATIKHAKPADRPEGGEDLALVQLKERRLEELGRLIDVGLEKGQQLAVAQKSLPPEQEIQLMLGRNGSIAEFERVARAVRQLIVPEMELHGVFAAPDRDAPPKAKVLRFARDPAERKQPDFDNPADWDVRSDYDAGPLDQVVAGIRKVLGVEAPKNDPFAPPAERKPSPPGPSQPGAAPQRTRPSPSPRKPAMAAKPNSPRPNSPKPAAPAVEKPAQPTPRLNRHQRRKAERRMRRNRGPP
jgi:hypothetical protein